MDEVETLIFRTDRLGDFIISCPFIISYKKNNSKDKITIVSSEYNYNYINNFAFVNGVVPLKNENKFFSKILMLFKIVLLLRKKKYKKIIVLDGKKRSFFISIFLRGKKYILLQSRDLFFLSKILGYTSVFNYEIQNQLKNFSFLANLMNFKLFSNEINIYKDYKFSNSYNLSSKYIMIHLDEKWFSKYYYKDFTDINPSSDQINLFVKKILDFTNYSHDIIITTGSKQLDVIQNFVLAFNEVKQNIFLKKEREKSVFFLKNTKFIDIESIIKNSSYLLPILVDFETEISINDNESVINLEKKQIKNILFGKIPIIVNSKYCVLNLKGIAEECRYDPGGYAIINGNDI